MLALFGGEGVALSHQFLGDAGQQVGVVQPAAVVMPHRPHVQTRLVVPVGQEVVGPVVAHRLDGRRRGLVRHLIAHNGLQTCTAHQQVDQQASSGSVPGGGIFQRCFTHSSRVLRGFTEVFFGNFY